jgi:hypothetical protein
MRRRGEASSAEGVAALAVYLMSLACGAGGGTGGAEQGPLDVKVSQLAVTVANRSGRVLTDVRVTISSGIMPFTASYGRLDPGQRRDFSLAEFRARDGTQFNLRLHRPRAVRVTATDPDGKTHQVDLPWP